MRLWLNFSLAGCYFYEILHKYGLEMEVHLLQFQLSACVQLTRALAGG